jgi:hypothetical protein
MMRRAGYAALSGRLNLVHPRSESIGVTTRGMRDEALPRQRLTREDDASQAARAGQTGS